MDERVPVKNLGGSRWCSGYFYTRHLERGMLTSSQIIRELYISCQESDHDLRFEARRHAIPFHSVTCGEKENFTVTSW